MCRSLPKGRKKTDPARSKPKHQAVCYTGTNMDPQKKILIVEDEEAMLRLLSDALSEAGFQVVTAKDGVQGLGNAKTYHPDLILLDIILPEMDGITMMKTLRETDEWGKNVPIIVLTNLNADDAIMKAVVDNE